MVLPLVLEVVAFGMEVTATGQSLVGRSDTAAAVVVVVVVVVVGVVAANAVVTVHIQCSKQREYILLFGTNLCITSKLHHLCLKKVDRNIG